MKQLLKTKLETKDRREGRARCIALSRTIYQMRGKETFYVESESCVGRYYFVRFNSSFDGSFCSCKNFESNRSEKCKHLMTVENAIRFATIKEVDHFPEETRKSLSYEDDDYSF